MCELKVPTTIFAATGSCGANRKQLIAFRVFEVCFTSELLSIAEMRFAGAGGRTVVCFVPTADPTVEELRQH
jgi:hypothetical protein